MATYSFINVHATLSGVGGYADLGAGASVAKEGITITPQEDKNIMTIGADGKGMNTLVANESSVVTIRLLKTSPQNAILSSMYNLQTQSSATHGKNTITVRDVERGDIITLSGVAFSRRPDVTYAEEAGIMEWHFQATSTNQVLGDGNGL